jgi:hypothetical protein
MRYETAGGAAMQPAASRCRARSPRRAAAAGAETVATSAQNDVKNRMNDVSVRTVADDGALTVEVIVEKDVAMTIDRLMWRG